MKYHNIVSGRFIDRPNRFVAHAMIDGQCETVHVKNTGRCRELLVPDAKIYLEYNDSPTRSTAYDIVAVEKNGRLINMDSQAPNKVVWEYLALKEPFGPMKILKPETVYGDSRFDFYVETEEEKIFIEVKGVTLEDDNVVRFPDAPSERAIKHVEELIAAHEAGYRTCIFFVVQMEQVAYFTPNIDTQAALAEALRKASAAGVEIMAYNCKVTEDSLEIGDRVPVLLHIPDKHSGYLKDFADYSLLSRVPGPLVDWYRKGHRSLPWREQPTPYRVWISEIMLQQTRVEAVKPYFARFMEALPDVESLAEASEETLLKLWEGLGYYNRVRNLQKAAIQMTENYGGEMPNEYEELLGLQGIGTYTAGAIASIAFHRAYPAVDGNVLRVLSRVTANARNISDANVKTAVEQELRCVIPWDCPGDFNQALMELGACVCVPNGAPNCEACPLAHLCRAHELGVELDYPKKEKARERSIEEKTVLVIRSLGKTAVHKRRSKGLLAGMYELPSLEGYHTAEEVARYLSDNGIKPLRVTPLADAKHIFTHKEWHMRGYLVRVDELEEATLSGDSADWLYIAPEETVDAYPIPSAFAAYAKYLRVLPEGEV